MLMSNLPIYSFTIIMWHNYYTDPESTTTQHDRWFTQHTARFARIAKQFTRCTERFTRKDSRAKTCSLFKRFGHAFILIIFRFLRVLSDFNFKKTRNNKLN